jgi:hypothetical protein
MPLQIDDINPLLIFNFIQFDISQVIVAYAITNHLIIFLMTIDKFYHGATKDIHINNQKNG